MDSDLTNKSCDNCVYGVSAPKRNITVSCKAHNNINYFRDKEVDIFQDILDSGFGARLQTYTDTHDKAIAADCSCYISKYS